MYRLDRRNPKEPKSLPYTLEELLAEKLDPQHAAVLHHLTIPASYLGLELYLANATLEIAGSGAYDPHIPLDEMEMLSWPIPKVALTFSHWIKVGRGPVEAPFFEFGDDQWIPNPPPDHDSFFNKEYDWDLRPVSHMCYMASSISNYNSGPWRAARMFVTCFLHFQECSFLPVYIVTVIVIQPRQVGDTSGISPALASAALRVSRTVTPTSDEEVLFFSLKKWCMEHLQDPKAISGPLHALSVSSIRWRDFGRWDSSMRAFNVQKNLKLLPLKDFVEACEEFGFLLMKPL